MWPRWFDCTRLVFTYLFCFTAVLSTVAEAAGPEALSPKTGIVQGIVTDIGGSPLQEAHISAIQVIKRPHTKQKQVVQTGQDGKFCFSVLGQEMVLVSCTAPQGWRTRVSNRWVEPDTETLRYVVRKDTGNEQDFAPLRREVLIRGRVLYPEGRPVRDARIVGLSDLKQATCKTAGDGTFELRHPIVARWKPCWLTMTLYVDVPQLRMGRVRRVTFNERWEYYVDLQLLPYRQAQGTATDQNGVPIAGLSILRRNHYLSLKWAPLTITDTHGRFQTQDLLPGVCYSFCALSIRYGTPRSNLVYWTDDKTSIPSIQVLPRNKTLQGVVERADGTAIPGALVCVEPCLAQHHEVTADPNGRFHFTGLVADEVELQGRSGELHGSVKCFSDDKNVRLVLTLVCPF